MSFFPRGPFRGSSPPRVRSAVFAVGRRVFVACPDGRPARVTLTDDAGQDTSGSMRDGTEVEILAWRPLGSAGTRYRVRGTRDGLEGWLGVRNLSLAHGAPAPRPTAKPSP